MTRPAPIGSLLATAHALRSELAQNRASVRRRLRTCGRQDLIQSITGESALDRACEEVEMLIADLAAHERTTHRRAIPIVEIPPMTSPRVGTSRSVRVA